jgi:hypothetical protein
MINDEIHQTGHDLAELGPGLDALHALLQVFQTLSRAVQQRLEVGVIGEALPVRPELAPGVGSYIIEIHYCS